MLHLQGYLLTFCPPTPAQITVLSVLVMTSYHLISKYVSSSIAEKECNPCTITSR